MKRATAIALLTGLVLAAAAAAKPPGPPPRTAEGGPPPAWLETPRTSAWLAYTSFCWARLCVDFVPPSSRKDIPVVEVRRGELVRFHLGFEPKTVRLWIAGRTTSLPASRSASWRAQRDGLLVLGAVSGRGLEASYVVRLRLVS